MTTIAERLRDGADLGFVGRERELAALVEAATGDGRAVLAAFVHGPGGIGKTHLVHALLAALPDPVRGVRLDGRDIEPTPRGLRRALGTALDVAPEPAAVVAALGVRRTVLVIDTYEVLGLLDGWLRTTFLPGLPDTVLTVFAGRDRPASTWHTAAGWAGHVAEFPLTALSGADATRLLRARGLDERQARWADGFARGHPLALDLLAATVRADPSVVGGRPPAPAGLIETFLGRLPPTTATVVEAASTVRRVTEPILRAVLDVGDARAQFAALRALPFTERGTDGLLLHDVVRDTVGEELGLRDPDARRAYRGRAARFHTGRPTADPWQRTADLMFLIENPVLRDACFPSARPDHAVEPACPADGEAVAGIAARHETPAAAALLARWWARHPETFSVARGPDGAVAGFVQIVERDAVDPALVAADPVAGVWAGHLRDDPPARGERVLFMRRWLGRESGELRSPATSACWLDVKRVYMELRPHLRRIYSCVVDLGELGPIFVPLGFAPVGGATDLDGAAHQAVWLDFGPGSVDGWLGGLIGAETAADGTRPLSSRELQVIGHIADGCSNREIAARLFISEKTAGRHVSNIFTKLDVHTRAQATRIAVERGLTRADRG